MTAIPHTITVTKEQEEFLFEHPDLSLSAITQKAINEMIENNKLSAAEIRDMQRKIDNWHMIVDKQRAFIEKKGLLDIYIAEDV